MFEQVIGLVLQTKTLILEESKKKRVEEKGAADYVTNVDWSVQRFLAEELRVLFPHIGMVAEEQEASTRGAEKDVWILDPIDGTTNLIHDFNHSAVSLALCQSGEIVFGIVYNPFTEELFTAVKGKGSFLNGEAIHVSKVHEIGQSLIAVGTSPYRKDEVDRSFALFQKIFLDCQDIRRTGSAALDLCYIACGRTDAYFERHLNPWDFAAGSLILQEAGGWAGDWSGEPLPLDGKANVAATNGGLTHILFDYLNQY